MTQRERNEREWENPDNWSGLFGVYRSKRDTRLWVPKRVPWMGWTVNMAHPKAKLTMAGLVALPLAAVAIAKAIRRR